MERGRGGGQKIRSNMEGEIGWRRGGVMLKEVRWGGGDREE